MRKKIGLKLTMSVIGLMILLSTIFTIENLSLAQTTPQIVAYKITSKADLGAPGTENFWNEIPWVNISLTANIPMAPTSGLTHYVLVKAAWNGTHFILLVRWPDPSPAYGAWSASAAAIYPNASGPGLADLQELMPGVTYKVLSNYSGYITYINGTPVQGRLMFSYNGVSLLMPNATSIIVLHNGTILTPDNRPKQDLLYSYSMFYGYYINSSYYYPDRFAVMWYLGSNTPSQDAMNLGGDYPGEVYDNLTFTKVGGSLAEQGGSANIWMWVSGATWNNSQYDPAFKVNLWQNKSLTGLSYVNPGNHGFAVPLYTNNTALYEIDTAVNGSGIWYPPAKLSGLNGSLFYIWTGANWSDGYWTLEYVYPMNVPSSYLPYFVNITPNKIYYVAFAVWQGKLGETLFDKSITPSFLTLELVTTPPTASTSSSSSLVSSNVTSTETLPPSLPTASLYATIVGAVVALVVLVILYVVYRR